MSILKNALPNACILCSDYLVPKSEHTAESIHPLCRPLDPNTRPVVACTSSKLLTKEHLTTQQKGSEGFRTRRMRFKLGLHLEYLKHTAEYIYPLRCPLNPNTCPAMASCMCARS